LARANQRYTTTANKVQGEGGYDAARRYNDATEKFVKDKTKKSESLAGSAKDAVDGLTPTEKDALQHAKRGGQEQRDADLLRKLEKDR
jgi:hypothetical protein